MNLNEAGDNRRFQFQLNELKEIKKEAYDNALIYKEK